ncbi:MAG: UDP-N-acetylmuramoyl-L-alanine--D-glutamate ligase [Aquificae bacterium]|nr:UDP-N-acetylmuramoyl-L-alanine--D-glutamate ligase [Aquificota bacterium]
MKKILIYGKGKTGEAVKNFCDKNKIENDLVDDHTYNPNLLKNYTTIVVSPGIPFFHRIFKDAKKNNKEIIGEIEFAYRFLDKKNKIIVITGTDGKSTTTKLIAHILKSFYTVYIGGNYGIPFIQIVDKANRQPGIIVLELSSFQIYSLKTFKPDTAVFLNFSKDHLNWHKKLSHYFLSKEKLFKRLDKMGTAILNYDNDCIKHVKTSGNKMFFSQKNPQSDIFIKDKKIRINIHNRLVTIENTNKKLIGTHNSTNIGVSSAIALLYKVDLKTIKKQISTFEPLPHRLEFVKQINGVSFYNDSKSTTVQSLESAVKSFDKDIILILGGINKGGEFSAIKKLLSKKVKKAFILGKSKNEIKNMIEGCCKIELVTNIEEAVIKAYSSAETGDIVLLSPACASFDMFKNYEERGEAFKKALFKIDG